MTIRKTSATQVLAQEIFLTNHRSASMAQISTFVLRLVQFLGYFPIIFRNQKFDPLHKHSPNRNRISHIFSKFWCILPTIFYSLLGISVIFLFFLDFSNIKSSISPKHRANRGTFFSALILKSVSHIFCSIFIKVDMIYRRKAFQRFFNNFQQLLRFRETFLGNSTSLRCNRFEKRLHIETFAYLVLATLLSLELLLSLTMGKGFSFSHNFVYLVPAVLGYFHSIFSVLVLFFLNWYLEILKGIRGLVVNKDECRKTLSGSTKKRHLAHSWYCCGKRRKMRLNSGCNYIMNSHGVINLYNSVRKQVEQFNSLFWFWLAVDMGHSLLRIVISAYFISSLMSNQVYKLRSLLGNLITVLLYFYLLHAVCKKGSDIVEESKQIAEGIESVARLKGGNQVITKISILLSPLSGSIICFTETNQNEEIPNYDKILWCGLENIYTCKKLTFK